MANKRYNKQVRQGYAIGGIIKKIMGKGAKKGIEMLKVKPTPGKTKTDIYKIKQSIKSITKDFEDINKMNKEMNEMMKSSIKKYKGEK